MQLLGQLALVVERFLKQHPGVDEQDRRLGSDDADEVQKHHRFRAEGGDKRHLAEVDVFQRMFQHRRRRVVLVARIQRRHPVGDRAFVATVTRHLARLPGSIPTRLKACRKVSDGSSRRLR